MPFFVITYNHPNADGWQQHVVAHVEYLQDLLKKGTLRASGPFIGTTHKSAMLILSAANRDEVLDVIARDPFTIEGLVEDMTVTEGDPMFGTYHGESSRGRT
jgi:uncharacterized protein YciI